MFKTKKLKNLIADVNSRMKQKKDILSAIIRQNFEDNEEFRKGYGEGVTDYFYEKKNLPLFHFKEKCLINVIFLRHNEDYFIDKMLNKTSSYELGKFLGFFYFKLDEAIG